jgi:hypothetical protein
MYMCVCEAAENEFIMRGALKHSSPIVIPVNDNVRQAPPTLRAFSPPPPTPPLMGFATRPRKDAPQFIGRTAQFKLNERIARHLL